MMAGPDQAHDEPRLLTVKQVADRLQTKPHNVREWIYRGRLRATKPLGTLLIREDDLEELLEASVKQVEGDGAA